MNVCSFNFIFFLCLITILFPISKSTGYRYALLSFYNFVFLFTLIPNATVWIVLISFLIYGYGALRLTQRFKKGDLLFSFISFLLIVFIFIKKYAFLKLWIPQNVLHYKITFVGISYILFKLIHMMVDAKQKQLAPFNLISYANYHLGFFSLIAGPIQRYNDFYQFWSKIGENWINQREVLLAWSRVLTGMIKMGLFSLIALRISEKQANFVLANMPPLKTMIHFGIYFYTYPLYIYLNFSGYCDIVIGSARLLGLVLPENFNRPYLARNVNDFWNRWHMTLTKWIRDYIFMSSYKFVAERWSRHAQKAAYFLIFMTLFLAGLWHGSTWNFVIFALIHGIGIAAVLMYGDILKYFLKAAGVKAYHKNILIQGIAIVITLHYVCFSFLFFHCDLGRTINILKAVGQCLL